MSKELEMRRQGLVLLRKPVRRMEAAQAQVVREATTGRVVSVVAGAVAKPRPVLLPKVWAVAEGGLPVEVPKAGLGATGLLLLRSRAAEPVHDAEAIAEGATGAVAGEPSQGMAFYRRYTEAMLRRYLRLSMAAGRVPSLMGRELFRGHVTSYKVRSFEDVVIFCFDMEKLLGRLEVQDQHLIKRLALQQYSQGEAARILGLSVRNSKRLYGRALDRLSTMLLEARMLERLGSSPDSSAESCQGGSSRDYGASYSF